jgi:transcriptional regulator with XRE-family HTH domain
MNDNTPDTTIREIPDWAKRLDRLRKIQGLSQTDLANELGLTKATISQWLNGTIKELKGPNLINAARVLNTTPEYLDSGQTDDGIKDRKAFDERRPIESREDIMLRLFSKLSPTQQLEEIYRCHNLTERSDHMGNELIRAIQREAVQRASVTGTVSYEDLPTSNGTRARSTNGD